MMKNPLRKRLPKEFVGEIGKYLVIFLFMTITIGLISGFLVADSSMIKAYDESFDKYNIEDGNFELMEKADDKLISSLENYGVTIYDNNYIECDTDNNLNGEIDSTLRIFKNREEVNKVCLMKGKMPKKVDEIAIDRMYADNNKVSVGDKIEVAGRKLEVTGLVALSDYSALFSDNGDVMFDAVKFGVAIVTEDGYEVFDNAKVHYDYSWIYNDKPANDTEEKKLSDGFMKELNSSAEIVKYIPRYGNQAIQFTGEDMGSDQAMMIMLLYILITILAFVFAVTTNNTITKESTVIGTLRASGYTRGELLRHYISLPVITTLIAAVVGNILGYTVFKNIMAAMYYGSYSLPTYKTIWNAEAFILTTIIPLIIMIVINMVLISIKLKLSPLKFLRHDLSKSKKKKAVRLPHFKFLQRFRLRIILQNIPSYATLFVGILFAYVLLIFGMGMSPLLTHFQKETLDNMISKYQYVLKAPVETGNGEAEKYCYTSLDISSKKFNDEGVGIYGINENSKYIDLKLSGDEVYISDSFADKYLLKKGDKFKLHNKYSGEKYEFRIKGIYTYPSSIAVFMNEDYYRELFEVQDGYFNGYFSNEELTDIDDNYVLTKITEDDLTKVSRQLKVSMGEMFNIINIFAIILFVLLIYLLTKLIIEKNATSISMVKILGYENREIAGLYIMSTSIVIVISMIIGMVLSTYILRILYRSMMSSLTGWLKFYIEPKIYPQMFVIGIISYVVVAMLQYRKIKNVPMDEALKNVE